MSGSAFDTSYQPAPVDTAPDGPKAIDYGAKIGQARSAGYSDSEITAYLQKSTDLPIQAARDAKYSDTEILDHLAPKANPDASAAAQAQPAMATEDAYGQYAPAPDAVKSDTQAPPAAPMPTLDEFGRDISAPAAGQAGFNEIVNRVGARAKEALDGGQILTPAGEAAIDKIPLIGSTLINPAIKAAGTIGLGVPGAVIGGGLEAIAATGDVVGTATGMPGIGQFARGIAGIGEGAMTDMMGRGVPVEAPNNAAMSMRMRLAEADRRMAAQRAANAEAVTNIGKATDVDGAIAAAAEAVSGPKPPVGAAPAAADAMALRPADASLTVRPEPELPASVDAVRGEAPAAVVGEPAAADVGAVPGAEVPAARNAAVGGDALAADPGAAPEPVLTGAPDARSVGAAASAPDQVGISNRDMKSNRRRAEKDEILAPAEPNDSTIHVDGSFPTLAERSADPIISQQENLIRQRNPGEFIGEGKRLTENNKARVAAYDDLTIADPTLDTMRDDRNERWMAASDDILPNAKPVDTTPITDWVQQQLSDPRIRENDDVRRVLEGFADRLIDRDGNPKTDPAALWGIHDNLQNQLSKAKDPLNSTGAEKFAQSQLMQAKSLVDQALDKATDGRFSDALASYAEDSKAINAGVLLNKFRNNLTNMHGELQAQRFHSFVLDLAEKRGRPGLDPSMDISDQAMARLIAIDKDLKRAGLIKLGQASGSPTNLLGALAAKAGYDAAKSAIGGAPVVGGLLKAVPDYLAERKLQGDTARHLAEPEGGYRYPERPDPAPPRQSGQQQAPTAPATGDTRAPSSVGAASSTLDALDAEAARNGWRRVGPNEPLAPGQEVATGASGRQYVRDDSPASQGAAAPTPAASAAPAESLYASTVTKTPDGRAVPVRYVVREASSLIPSQLRDGRVNEAYPAELQPRDRTRSASLDQVSKMANTLDPERLGYSADTSTGAPVVGPDGFVESGNGRMMAIQQALAGKGISALRYRAWVNKQGFDTTGMKNPVLVRERVGDMSMADRAKLAGEMGKSAILEMSAPEKASADAKLLTPDMLSLLKRGSLTTGNNGDFAKAFAKQAMSGSERGGFMADDGTMSKGGEERVRNALAQRAYESNDLVSKMSEDTDPDMKAFGGALMDAAPMMAKLRGAIELGQIPKGQDLSPAIVEAANLVKRARQNKTSVASEVAQNDAFSQRLPQTEQILKAVFSDDFSRRMSRQRFGNLLNNYADAMHNEYSMFGDSRPAGTVMRDEILKMMRNAEATQTRLLP